MKEVQFRAQDLRISFLLVVLLIFSDGCSFLKPSGGEAHNYLLTAEPSSQPPVAQRARPYAIRVLPVEMPDYLKTADMVTRTGTNEIVFAKFHQWAEPLDAGIRRILVQNLQASHGVMDVLTDEPSPPNRNVFVVSVRILTCEAEEMNGRSSVVFDAAWEVSEEGTQARTPVRGVFHAPSSSWHSGDFSGLANQLSIAVAGLARELDQAISAQTDGGNP